MNNCSIAKGDDLKYAALRRQSLFIIHHSSFIPLRVRGIVGSAEVKSGRRAADCRPYGCGGSREVRGWKGDGRRGHDPALRGAEMAGRLWLLGGGVAEVLAIGPEEAGIVIEAALQVDMGGTLSGFDQLPCFDQPLDG